MFSATSDALPSRPFRRGKLHDTSGSAKTLRLEPDRLSLTLVFRIHTTRSLDVAVEFEKKLLFAFGAIGSSFSRLRVSRAVFEAPTSILGLLLHPKPGQSPRSCVTASLLGHSEVTSRPGMDVTLAVCSRQELCGLCGSIGESSLIEHHDTSRRSRSGTSYFGR